MSETTAAAPPAILSLATTLDYRLSCPTDLLLQIEAAMLPEQRVISAWIDLPPTEHFARVPAHDCIGDRIWLRADGQFRVSYSATVAVERLVADIAALGPVPLHLLPGETVQYLFGSRYCPVIAFSRLVEDEFAGTAGGARVAAIRDFIAGHFTYLAGTSDSETDAMATFIQREGVCRDYAHVLIALARASNIPARFASVYAPDVDPPDFHAVAEVFLAHTGGGGAWHLVDATGMATAGEMAKIGVGRDAADVSFLTVFGSAELCAQCVTVTRVSG